MLDFRNITAPLPHSEKELFQHISQEQIFEKYFGSFTIGTCYKSVFRKDNNPSTGFYYSRTGVLYYNDLAKKLKWNAISFVAELYHTDYKEAIRIIAKDNNITSRPAKQIFEKSTPKPVDTIIQFEPDVWTAEHLNFWSDYCTEREEALIKVLEKEKIYPVKKLFINKIKRTVESITFAFVETIRKKDYLQIYAPFSTDKWKTNIPGNIIYNIDKLRPKHKNLIITKSKKDLLVLKEVFKNTADVVATRNESERTVLPYINEFKKVYDTIIIFWDNDETGVEECTKLNKQGLGYVNIPKNMGVKDPSDYVKKYSYEQLTNYLKTKIPWL